MEHDPSQNAETQNGVRDARTHINRQKTRDGIEPPRTVAEQDEELLSTAADGVTRRDPVRAAELQHTTRDNGVGGALIDATQRANEPGVGEPVFYEKLPDRHAERADGEPD